MAAHQLKRKLLPSDKFDLPFIMKNIETPERSGSHKLHLGRVITESVLLLPLNYELIDQSGAVHRVEEVQSQGKALVIGYSHFSRRDGLIYGTYALHFAKHGNLPIVLPVALHQYDDFKPELDAIARICNGRFCPIVIDDTVEREKYKNLQIGDGMDEYMYYASDAIQKGGIVALSVLGGRKASLAEGDAVPALSTLLATLYRHRVQNYAVHFVGIAPKQNVTTEDYKNLNGWNFKMRYTVRPGNVYSFEQLREMYGLNSIRDYAKIDTLGYKEIAGLVQESYWGGYKP